MRNGYLLPFSDLSRPREAPRRTRLCAHRLKPTVLRAAIRLLSVRALMRQARARCGAPSGRGYPRTPAAFSRGAPQGSAPGVFSLCSVRDNPRGLAFPLYRWGAPSLSTTLATLCPGCRVPKPPAATRKRKSAAAPPKLSLFRFRVAVGRLRPPTTCVGAGGTGR